MLAAVLALPRLLLQHGGTDWSAMLLNPFCPLSAAKILSLKATVILLLTLLIKSKIRIATFSGLGALLLLLQTLVFLAISGGVTVVAAAAAVYAVQQRKTAAASV